ncbi:hypothetical protein [Vibrio sonorensis]|uniref:hypothetical protein n=1 Tax=Vibrio sonorensis TaxID=1004316 RepID=UPI0008DAEB1A|nr:hypothetical protein [Vibrio sonorensis]
MLTPTLTTPKGHELIPLAESLAPEEMDEIRRWLFEHLVALLEQGKACNELNLSALNVNQEQLAQLILSGITGVKHSVKTMEELESQSRLFFDVLFNGLKHE